jgi:hypothetical protein
MRPAPYRGWPAVRSLAWWLPVGRAYCGLGDERGYRFRLRHVDGVAGRDLRYGGANPSGHGVLRRRRDHPVFAGEIGFDGFSECWFRDETQFRNAVESSTWAVAVEDAHNVFDITQMWGAALKENVVVPPPLLGI